MRKRILSLVLSLCIVAAMLPMGAITASAVVSDTGSFMENGSMTLLGMDNLITDVPQTVIDYTYHMGASLLLQPTVAPLSTVTVNNETQLRDAIQAATDSSYTTIQLGQTIANITSSIVITNKNIIIDLKGYNLTTSESIKLTGTTNLEIKDTSHGENGTLHGQSWVGTIVNEGNGTFKISSGTLSTPDNRVSILNNSNGNVVVSGGEVDGLVSSVSSDGKVTVSGGTLGYVRAKVLYLSGNPTLNIVLGTLTSGNFFITGPLTGDAGNIKLMQPSINPPEENEIVAIASNESYADVSKFELLPNDGKTLAQDGAYIVVSSSTLWPPDTSEYAATVTPKNGTPTNYKTVTAAWAEASKAISEENTATITLLRNVTNSCVPQKVWPLKVDGSYITLDLNGYDINRDLTERKTSGSIFDIRSGHLTIEDNTDQEGSITGANKLGSGGAILLYDGTLTMTGGNITGNRAIRGSAVSIYQGTFNMSGGIIDRNIMSSWGGAVYIQQGTFNMSGGSITNNEGGINVAFGVGVVVDEGATFTMTGGSITGNKVQPSEEQTMMQPFGAGVTSYGTFNVSGPVNITQNVAITNGEENASNVNLIRFTSMINVIGSLEGASIGVSRDQGNTGTGRFTRDYKDHNLTVNPTTIFTADNPGVKVQQKTDGEAYLVAGDAPDTDPGTDPTNPGPTPPVTPGTYTVVYNANGGTGTMPSQTTNVGTTTTVTANTFIRTGYTFNRWTTAANGTGTAYVAGSTVPSQTAGTTVTLYAQWRENTYTVSGDVTDHDNKLVTDARVKLMLGRNQIGSTVNTDEDGKFIIANIPNGTYNLVVEKEGIIVTRLIEVKGSDFATGTIKLPSGKTNSIVDVKAGAPSIVVGGLDEQFTDDDKDIAADGGTVEIKFTAQKKAENDAQNANDIKATASNNGKKVGIFLDLTVTKTVTGHVYDSTTTLTELQNPIEVLIPLDAADQNKSDYVVYRYHGTSVDIITTTANADGEKIELIDNGTTIKLTIKKFSTYAIAYTETSTTPPGTTPSRDRDDSNDRRDTDEDELDNGNVIIKNTPGGTIEESPDSTDTDTDTEKTFLITPDKGYVIADILVDGKSVGAAKTYTFKNLTKEVEIQAVFVKATAIPYHNETRDKDIFIGYSRVKDGIMTYIAPQGVTVLFKDNPKYFNDISGHAAIKEIDFVTERNLFVGTAPNVFSPEMPFTRAMFVTVIGKLHGASFGEITESTHRPFTDVAQDSWYNKYVTWAEENNIVRGVGGGKFEPDRAMTRQEMAVIMDKYLTFITVDLPAFDLPASEEVVTFIDQANIAQWAAASVQAMQQIGMVETMAEEPFNPKGNVTRAQAVTWIYRLIHRVMD